jgi:hypothetical protein
VPLRHDAFADTLFPIKLIEYLAAGRPVVGTPLDAVLRFGDVTYAAATPAHFAASIERAATEDSPRLGRRRIEAAAPHSWDRRIEQLDAAIRDAIEGATP